MNISLNARSKILHLSSDGKPFRIQVSGDFISGVHIDLVPNSSVTALDVTICNQPFIIADLGTVNHMDGRTVDFDYGADEFVITTKDNT